MTIAELIEKLNEYPDKNIDVEALTTRDFGQICYDTISEIYIYTDKETSYRTLILQ